MYESHVKPEKLVLPIWQRLWQKIMASPAVILLVLAAVLCLAANHLLVVTDPVESNYVLTAREMLASGDYVSPRIFGNYWYDKPIFFYWELIAAFKLFGVSDFAARFFPALFGIVGILLAYGFTARLYDKKTAFLTGLILLTTVEYFYLSKAIITDMTLFVFYSACLMAFYIAYSEGKPRWYYLAYFFAGLAVLTKGPIGLFQPGLIILLLELPWKAAEFAIIIFVVQQVDGNFIAPRILGGATGLPGLGVLLAIVVGGAWFGIPGMVAGVPTLAVLAALARQAVGAGLTARGLPDEVPPDAQEKTVTKKAKN